MNSKIDLKRALFFRSIVWARGLGQCPVCSFPLLLLLMPNTFKMTMRGASLGVEDRS